MAPLPNNWRCRRTWPLITAVLAVWILTTPGVAQQAPPSDPPAAAMEKIRIRSDRLVADNDMRIAEFSGNVRAEQGDTIIEADRLKVYYRTGDNPSRGGEETAVADRLDRIVASGNVRIHFENRLAVTQEAVYNVDSQVIELIGDGTRVSSGPNYIEGEKITLRRGDGKVTVEGGETRQVEAIFFPGSENGQ